MKKNILVELISNNHSHRTMASELNCSQSTIRYWLNKYNLKTNNEKHNKNTKPIKGFYHCNRCESNKPASDFYFRKNRNTVTSYCKLCNSEYHKNRLINIKRKMVKYKGDKCDECGIEHNQMNYAIFDFHHLDPTKKDSKFKNIKHRSWDIIKKEIEKCVLVCSNCHRLIHSNNGSIAQF